MSDERNRDVARATTPDERPDSPAIVQTARASLRATEVYARALSDRFELACATDLSQLAQIPADFLLHVVAVSEAFQGAAKHTLWHIEPELARSAHVIAGLARDGAGGGNR